MQNTLITIAAFLLVITPLVFIHEFGHYIVAKMSGVKIDTFSIGFGKEIFGWNDKSGTRWKVCILPFGGYVQMYGDATEAGGTDEIVHALSDEEKELTFHYKPLYKKAAIVMAGPLMNIILAIAIFAFIFTHYGYPNTIAAVGEVAEDSVAEKAGLQKGDVFISIDGKNIKLFTDIQRIVALNPNVPMEFKIMRGDEELTLVITPAPFEMTSVIGEKAIIGRLGVSSGTGNYEPLPFGKAFIAANKYVYNQAGTTLTVIGDIFTGDKSVKVLGGPIKIAMYSGASAKGGVGSFFDFMAKLSFALGFFNLFPIPALDGGHLMYYLFEAVRGKPLADKYQEYGMRVGFAILIGLIVFITFNDIVQLFS